MQQRAPQRCRQFHGCSRERLTKQCPDIRRLECIQHGQQPNRADNQPGSEQRNTNAHPPLAVGHHQSGEERQRQCQKRRIPHPSQPWWRPRPRGHQVRFRLGYHAGQIGSILQPPRLLSLPHGRMRAEIDRDAVDRVGHFAGWQRAPQPIAQEFTLRAGQILFNVRRQAIWGWRFAKRPGRPGRPQAHHCRLEIHGRQRGIKKRAQRFRLARDPRRPQFGGNLARQVYSERGAGPRDEIAFTQPVLVKNWTEQCIARQPRRQRKDAHQRREQTQN